MPTACRCIATLDILTARPDASALSRVPHRLYGELDGAELCSAARWAEMARDAIAEAAGEGRLPILVGGTGLYIRTLVSGIAAVPEIPDEVRHAARALHAEIGGQAFWERLKERRMARRRRGCIRLIGSG